MTSLIVSYHIISLSYRIMLWHVKAPIANLIARDKKNEQPGRVCVLVLALHVKNSHVPRTCELLGETSFLQGAIQPAVAGEDRWEAVHSQGAEEPPERRWFRLWWRRATAAQSQV